MAEHSAFVETVLKTLAPLGEVRPKRMFGGYGLFLDDTMFALITRGEELFLKADEVNRDDFLARGAGSHGKMPYYAAPPEAVGDWSAMEPWARGAVAAAQRGKKSKKK